MDNNNDENCWYLMNHFVYIMHGLERDVSGKKINLILEAEN